MRLASLIALFLSFALPAHAQRAPLPLEAFAGQGVDGVFCDPNGSTGTMAVCYGLWLEHEEALLRQSVLRLADYAREQQARSEIFAGPTGYVQSITTTQDGWLDWRNRECWLMTLDDVGGSIRRLSYPNCLASLTAQRRERLDAVLVFWEAEFRDDRGEASGVSCVLEPTAFHHCGR